MKEKLEEGGVDNDPVIPHNDRKSINKRNGEEEEGARESVCRVVLSKIVADSASNKLLSLLLL